MAEERDNNITLVPNHRNGGQLHFGTPTGIRSRPNALVSPFIHMADYRVKRWQVEQWNGTFGNITFFLSAHGNDPVPRTRRQRTTRPRLGKAQAHALQPHGHALQESIL